MTTIHFQTWSSNRSSERPFLAESDDVNLYMVDRFGSQRHGLTISQEGEVGIILNRLNENCNPITSKECTIGVTTEPMWSPWNFRPAILEKHCRVVLTPFPWRFSNGVFGLCLLPPWAGSLEETVPTKDRELSYVVSPQSCEHQNTLYRFRHHLVDEILKSTIDCDIYGDWHHKGPDSRLKGVVSNKRDAIAPYRRTIAIENSIYPGYSTEKLIDGIICETQVIYLGDPVAPLIFDGAVVPLCANNPIEHIQKVLQDTVPVEKMRYAKELYLSRYNLMAQLALLIGT